MFIPRFVMKLNGVGEFWFQRQTETYEADCHRLATITASTFGVDFFHLQSNRRLLSAILVSEQRM